MTFRPLILGHHDFWLVLVAAIFRHAPMDPKWSSLKEDLFDGALGLMNLYERSDFTSDMRRVLNSFGRDRIATRCALILSFGSRLYDFDGIGVLIRHLNCCRDIGLDEAFLQHSTYYSLVEGYWDTLASESKTFWSKGNPRLFSIYRIITLYE